jgi:PTS system ascorbate-specific IIA component
LSAGIVIVTHGQIGRSLLEVAQFILACDLDEIHFLSFNQSDINKTAPDNVRNVIASADQGDGVLVLTDLPGASPCNLVEDLLKETGATMVSGLNLAMLIRVWNYRDRPARELATLAAEGGRRAIRQAGP